MHLLADKVLSLSLNELERGVALGDQVTDRIATVEGIKQVAHLGGIPDEGPLDFRYGELAGFGPGQQGVNGMRGDRVPLCCSQWYPSTISPNNPSASFSAAKRSAGISSSCLVGSSTAYGIPFPPSRWRSAWKTGYRFAVP